MSEPTDRAARDLDAALIPTIGILLLSTIALVLEPGLQVVADAPRLDLVINTVATLAATGIAGLAFTRFTEQGGASLAMEAAAFSVLAAAGAVSLSATLAGVDEAAGLALTRPTQVPVYIWTVARLLASGLLLGGALLELRRHRLARPRGARILLAALVAFGILLVTILVAAPVLPPLVTPAGLAGLATPAARIGATGIGAAAQVAGAALFLGAAIAIRRLPRVHGGRPRSFLVLGLVLAAFSQVHFALHPGAHTNLVTTGDVLRLAFYVVLLAGVARDTRDDLRALHVANAGLERMRDADVVRATLEERGRLAREIHDGLAQDLWTAKLKQGRVAQAPELGPDTRATAREVVDFIDTALADARQAVMALRAEPGQETRLDAMLREYFEDFVDRFGLRGTAEVGDPLPGISVRAQAEVMRIVQEALSNVRKHADATVVRLSVAGDGSGLRVTVSDNGRGFDPRGVPDDRFGLRVMRERAELIGARLDVRSALSGGTTVTLLVPDGAVAA